MFLVDTIILLVGVLVILGIVSSKFSSRLGIPVLLLFLALGMLAGSEGIGGLHFEDFSLAHGIGTWALAIILYDGGLRTPLEAIRAAWKPAALLSTVGVFLTAMMTGLAAVWILDLPLLTGLLLGSIVSSTDAAAVFAVLRSGGVYLPRRLADILEMESASNDPMAIFLTVGLIEIVLGRMELGAGVLTLFASQWIVGAVVGLALGYATVLLVNRLNLDAAGLYPVLVTACGFSIYGLAAVLGGSGFLAIYLAGIVVGQGRLVFQRGILLFHDAAAWLAQIVMFVVLGLLCTPTALLKMAGPALSIAAVLFFVSRPLAVLVTIWPFRLAWNEVWYLCWVGLKGAVPITLATFPLMLGVPHAALIFNVVFFVVLVSALVQGGSLAWLAKKLGLWVPPKPEPPVTLELSSLRHVEGDIVDYLVDEKSRAAGKWVRDLALPEGAVLAILARQQQILPPQGNTKIEPGDHVIVILRPNLRPLVDTVFASEEIAPEVLPAMFEFPLRGSIRVGDLEEFYGIQLAAPAELTLAQLMESRLGKERIKLGAAVKFTEIALHVRSLSPEGVIEYVGMVILEESQLQPPEQTTPKQTPE